VRFKTLASDTEAPQGRVARQRKGIDSLDWLVLFGPENVLHHEAGAGRQYLAGEPQALHGKICGFPGGGH
jgi:hypothetical protein